MPKPPLSHALLAYFGNASPSVKQVELMEALLNQIGLTASLVFDSRLSKRESECLALAALGRSCDETAEALKLSKKTVEQYRSAIKKKLGCKNMVQAAVQGIKYRCFQFDHEVY